MERVVKKSGDIIHRLSKVGIAVKKIETDEELKSNNWILPTSDKKGRIVLELKELGPSKIEVCGARSRGSRITPGRYIIDKNKDLIK